MKYVNYQKPIKKYKFLSRDTAGATRPNRGYSKYQDAVNINYQMYFLPVLMLSMLLIGPRLTSIDFHALAVIILSLAFVIRAVLTGRVMHWIRLLTAFSIPVGIYSVIVNMVSAHGTFESSYIFVKYLVYLAAVGFVLDLYFRCNKRSAGRNLFNHAIYLWSLLGITAIAFVFFPDFRAIIEAYWFIEGREHWMTSGYRAFDIVSGGGFNGAIGYVFVTTALFILAPYYNWSGRKMIFFGLIIFTAGALMARSYIVLLMVSVIVVSSLRVLRTLSLRSAKFSATSVFPFLALLIVIVSALVGLYYWLPEVSRNWVFEAISDGAIASPGSLKVIVDRMYFWPKETGHFLFGSGYLGRDISGPYIPSDVGYVRVMFNFGLVGSLFLWGPLLALFFGGARAFLRSGDPYGILTATIIMVIIVGNFKELVLFPRSAGVFSLLMIGAFLSGFGGVKRR